MCPRELAYHVANFRFSIKELNMMDLLLKMLAGHDLGVCYRCRLSGSTLG